VADLLQARPDLTPNQVKWLLQKTAQPLSSKTGIGAGYPQAAAAVAYTGTIGLANQALVPNNLVASAACATLTGCTNVSWGSVKWNSVDWNSVDWSSVAWDSVKWNATWEVAPSD
jgi:serine protease AprX